MVVSSPDAAAKVFRAEGKYPVRLYSQADVSWIYTNAGSPPAIAFAYVFINLWGGANPRPDTP